MAQANIYTLILTLPRPLVHQVSSLLHPGPTPGACPRLYVLSATMRVQTTCLTPQPPIVSGLRDQCGLTKHTSTVTNAPDWHKMPMMGKLGMRGMAARVSFPVLHKLIAV